MNDHLKNQLYWLATDITALRIAATICAAVYVVILTVVPSNLGGDTADYLAVALALCGEGKSAGFNPFRGWGYPAFQCVVSGRFASINAIFYAQTTIFLGALYFACRNLTSGWRFAIFAVVAASIPHYAYLQKLLYPDGLITSLILFYLIFAAKRQFAAAFLIVILLAFVKLLFVFLFAHLLLLAIFEKGIVTRHLKAFIIGGLVAAASFVVAFPFAFPDVSYITVFVRQRASIESVIPKVELRFVCGGAERTVSHIDIDRVPLTVFWQTAPYGPLSQEHAQAFACTKHDIRKLELAMIASSLRHAPAAHLGAYFKVLASSFIGQPLYLHAYPMLRDKLAFLSKSAATTGVYDEHDLTTLRTFEPKGIRFSHSPIPPFGRYVIDGPVRIFAVSLIAFAVWSLSCRGRLRNLIEDRIAFSLAIFLCGYALALSASAAVLSDRYTFVSFLVLCFLGARAAQIAWPSTPANDHGNPS